MSGQPGGVVLGLDIGSKRLGVARGSTISRLATPLAVIAMDGHEFGRLKQLIDQENAVALVAGLPRGLDGQETEQTRTTRNFASRLESLGLPLFWQDEAATSVGLKRQRPFGQKKPIDDRAAAIILQDYLDTLR
ncbi:MAG TPA: Holliday junction resolvase RuvX [Candidatus Saccharimonadales bacterium]